MFGRRSADGPVALLLLTLCVGSLAACSGGPAPSSVRGARAPHAQSTIIGWLQNAEPAGWDSETDRIVINRRGEDNLWDAYTIHPNGHDARCITCEAPSFPGVGSATNRGASDVSPDGRYILLVVEKGSHPGLIGAAESEPGRGVYNDLWLATADGRHVWRLTDLPASGDQGLIWPRFDRTGSQIVWAQMYAPADLGHPLGQWALKTARVQWTGGTPRLGPIRTYDPQPGRFFEPYGFSPDDQRILFASDVTVPSRFLSPSAFNAQIWTIDAANLDDLTRVSPPRAIAGPFSDYNEFAYYVPGTDKVVFATTVDAAAHGMDYWTANADGADARRLTFMNQPGTKQYRGYSVGGGLAFDPRDRHRFVAGVSHDPLATHVQAVFVTIG